MIRSLRARLFLGICAVSLLVLGLLSLAIDAVVHATLQAEFDNVLLEKARTLASLVEQSGPLTHFDYQAEEFPEFNAGPKAAYFEVTLDGKPYQHSASLGEGHLPMRVSPGTSGAEYYKLPDGRRGRLLVMDFEPLVETDDSTAGPAPKLLPRGTLAVAQDSSSLERTLERLRLFLVALGAGATLLAGGLLMWVTGRAVRPVQKLARQIDAMGERDLSTPISAADLPSELAPVVERLNGLLQRLEEAFTRERAFTADVAHELRTPLAGLLVTLEVARTRPREPEAYEAAIDKSLGILRQMQALVENLLLLARAESGQLAVKTQPLDVAALLEECRAAFEESAERRELAFLVDAGDPAALSADREILRVVFYNLLDNAVSYASAGSRIRLRVSGEAGGRAGGAAIEIANTCSGLVPTDLPGLFQRFVRKDASRSANGVHAGLGLSICQRLLNLLHGSIELRLEEGQFVARVTLPQGEESLERTMQR